MPGDRESTRRAGPEGSRACRLESPSDSETRLVVSCEDLRLTDRREFGASCDRALASGATRIVVDLTSLTNIYSLFIGALVDLALRGRAAGKTVVIRAGGRVAESLRLMNVDATAELEVP